MKKSFFALLMAGTMILSMTYPAFAEEAVPEEEEEFVDLDIGEPLEVEDVVEEVVEDIPMDYEEEEFDPLPEEMTELEEIPEGFFETEERVEISTESGPVIPLYDVSVYDSAYPVWNANIRVGIRNENQLIRESGMSLDDWDELIENRKKEGLADPVTETEILAQNPDAQICRENGSVYYIGANSAFPQVTGVGDAYRLAYSLTGMLGCPKTVDLMLWSRLSLNDGTVYSFQQLSGTEEALGKTMKIAVGADGTVSAVFSSLDPETVSEDARVPRARAEEAVLIHMEREGARTEILSGYTERTIHALETVSDLQITDDDDPIPKQILWVVYTPNESAEGAVPEDAPYLAHYVTLDGRYQYSLPVREPGCEEALSGYAKTRVFDGMIADSYRTVLVDSYGRTFEVAIPVMYSQAQGQWILGDVNRRIVVADHRELAYTDEHTLSFVTSLNNEDWDPEDVWMMYNYIRAWDFYAAMGWTGPDGQGTDVMILKNLSMVNGAPYENACSIGKIENWQMFGYSGYSSNSVPLKLVRGLDVMAHEYTHTFTAAVMNNNLYKNDAGAINEAMSDIMGNLIEYMYQDTADPSWLLGEQTARTIRSMTEPEDYDQPDYVWDISYGPHVDEPSAVNDRGGVHFNSSLLNRIAALLCRDGGMPLEEAVKFWITVALGLTPETDYPQISQLLRWAAVTSGEEAYAPKLEELIGEGRLEQTALPEEIPSDRKLVILEIPDTEAFRDENWGLVSLQFDTGIAMTLSKAVVEMIVDMLTSPEGSSDIAVIVDELAENLRLDRNKLRLDTLENEDSVPEIISRLGLDLTGKLISQGASWEEMDTGRIPMMCKRGNPTLYLLVNMTDGGATMQGLVVLIGEHWYDLSPFIGYASALQKGTAGGAESGETSEQEPGLFPDLPEIPEGLAEDSGKLVLEILTNMEKDRKNGSLFTMLDTGLEIVDEFLIEDDEITMVKTEPEYLPTDGLEKVKLTKKAPAEQP